MMRYISTRGGMEPRRFSDILLEGLAPDGGLTMPETYPQVTLEELKQWQSLSYPELAFEVLKKFIDDIPEEDLRTIINKTYTTERFDDLAIAPVRPVGPDFYLLELSHGPTLAFKDMAMQLLGNLFEYVLEKENRELNILGATSGDTGSSAEYAMRGKSRIRVFMLSPDGKMSPFQTAQMYTLPDENIYNIAIKGVFDDCQDIVKATSNDAEFKKRYSIGTVNSINWARIVAQLVYYIYGYLHAVKTPGDPVSFCVPTGNFGNICAGYIARKMGVPIDQLILATNENDVLDEFFKTGKYRPRGTTETRQTSSPSMDISKASNFERFIFDLVDRDPEVVKSLWKQLNEQGYFDLSNTPWFAHIKETGFVSGSSTHADRMKTIAEIDKKYNRLIDTHTADGVKVGLSHKKDNVPLVCLETAQPIKFEAAIFEATGKKPEAPAAFLAVESLPQRVQRMPINTEMVKNYIAEHVA